MHHEDIKCNEIVLPLKVTADMPCQNEGTDLPEEKQSLMRMYKKQRRCRIKLCE